MIIRDRFVNVIQLSNFKLLITGCTSNFAREAIPFFSSFVILWNFEILFRSRFPCFPFYSVRSRFLDVFFSTSLIFFFRRAFASPCFSCQSTFNEFLVWKLYYKDKSETLPVPDDSLNFHVIPRNKFLYHWRDYLKVYTFNTRKETIQNKYEL